MLAHSAGTPAGADIPLMLDNETWSFTYTPDVRYGREKLYQAFQLHTHHLHRLALATERSPQSKAAAA